MRNGSEIALFEFCLSLFSFVDLTMTEAETTLLLQEGKQKTFLLEYSGGSRGLRL
jgi:hypothetical protein